MSHSETLAVPTEVEAALSRVTESQRVLRVADKHSIMLAGYQWDLALFHLVDDHSSKGKPWCNTRCFSRWADRGARWSDEQRRKTRSRMLRLFDPFLERGVFLVFDDQGPELAMRLLRADDDPDICKAQLDQMHRRRELSSERAADAERAVREILGGRWSQ